MGLGEKISFKLIYDMNFIFDSMSIIGSGLKCY